MAAGALARGFCRSELAGAMCSVILTISTNWALNIWIGRATGPINPADPPSRNCPRCPHLFRAPHKELLGPGLFARVFESKGSLMGSRFKVGAAPEEFQEAWPRHGGKPGREVGRSSSDGFFARIRAVPPKRIVPCLPQPHPMLMNIGEAHQMHPKFGHVILRRRYYV